MGLFGKKPQQDEASLHDERSPTENTSEDAAETGSQLEHKSPLTEEEEANLTFPHGFKLVFLLASIFVGMFVVALDRLIISTAIPQITDEFHAANDIGWYATAYLLTSCSFQLLFGKIYAYFNIKWGFLFSILIFLIGSAICGAAPTSVAFIIGRAIAGLGSGGVQAGCLVVILYAVPLHKRPAYQGLFGAVFGIASVAGPLIGGAFTTNITWRWCFYVNLPIGAVVMVMVFFLLDVPDRPSTHIPLKDKLVQLNAYGLVVLVPAVVCLCLALQWGGTTYSWGNARIIVLLILAILLFIAFALIQVWKPEQATTPPRIFLQRSIWSGFLVSVCLGAHLNIFVYYLPIWFQAIDGLSAVDSGIHLLPTLLSLVLGSMLAGLGTTKVGYYTPFLLIGIAITATGAGLISTFNVNTTKGQWIGYQIVYGFGFGASSQMPNVAAQTVLKRDDVPIGATLMFFGLQLAGAIFTSVGENVLNNQLVNRFQEILPLSPAEISSGGVTNILKLVPANLIPQALVAYNDSVREVFRVGLIVACISLLGGLAMEWVSVKKNIKKKPADHAGETEKGVTTSSRDESTTVGEAEAEAKPA